MSDTKKVLRSLLKDHTGKHNSITQGKLANALGMNTSTLRSEISRLREERNIPIGNVGNGYFVIDSKEDLADFVAYKNNEIQSRRETIEDTHSAFESFDIENIDIDPEPEVQEQTYTCSKCESETPRSTAKWPKDGQFADHVLCEHCFGELVMNGEA